MKTIVIAGGTGFIGKNLTEFFLSNSYKVIILSRGSSKIENNIEYVQWDAKNQGNWSDKLNGAFAVINLSGRTINCRHNEKNKKSILDSRVNSTTAIGEAIKNCDAPPEVWINASGISIYKDSYDKLYEEDETDYADDFVAEVAKKWEEAVFQFNFEKTRQVSLRIGVVLGEEGALSVLKKQTKMGAGGKHGSGKQIMPWIHLADLIGAINFILENKNIEDRVNGISPNPVSDKDFMNALRKSLNVKIGLPAPAFAIKIGGYLLGVEPNLILASKSAYPKKMIDAGYNFQYPEIQEALNQIHQ